MRKNQILFALSVALYVMLSIALYVMFALAVYRQTVTFWGVSKHESGAEDQRASIVEQGMYGEQHEPPASTGRLRLGGSLNMHKIDQGLSSIPPTHLKNEIKAKESSGLRLAIDKLEENQRSPPVWAKENATEYEPYLAETQYHHGTFSVSKIVKDGPAKPYFPKGADESSEANLVWPSQNEKEAICTLEKNAPGHLTMSGQFPHNLQQLLRCFSWWQMNPKQQPVLHLEQNYEWGKSRYILEFYNALHEVFGVRLDWVERNGNAPGVTVPIHWAYMESLLDAYAMNSQDARTLADGFFSHYIPNNKRAGCPKLSLDPNQQKLKPVVGFLNREGSRRTIENSREIMSALNASGYEARYMKSFDGMSLTDQMSFVSEVDILMGPHGAQFTNTLFQPECGSLFEFFPEHYYGPNFFGSLAALSGKHHFFLYNGGKTERGAFFEARSTPSFKVNPSAVIEVTHQMVDRWHTCCQLGFRGG